jgi:hypothetical protein
VSGFEVKVSYMKRRLFVVCDQCEVALVVERMVLASFCDMRKLLIPSLAKV